MQTIDKVLRLDGSVGSWVDSCNRRQEAPKITIGTGVRLRLDLRSGMVDERTGVLPSVALADIQSDSYYIAIDNDWDQATGPKLLRSSGIALTENDGRVCLEVEIPNTAVPSLVAAVAKINSITLHGEIGGFSAGNGATCANFVFGFELVVMNRIWLGGEVPPDAINDPEYLTAAQIRALIAEYFRPEPGPPGKPGKDGKDGTPGKDGNNGLPGTLGTDGKDGKDGAAGEQGPPGQGLTWDAAGSLQERDAYANEAAGFTFASFVTDAANKTTKLYLYKKRTSAHGDWCAPVVITYYSRDGENVKLIPPLEFVKPAGTQNYLYFAQSEYPAATIAAVCIDTAEGELRLPYDSALGVTKIVKKNGTFYVYFGSLVPAFTTGRVYFAQGVMSGEVIPPTGGAPMYFGYIVDDNLTTIKQVAAAQLEAGSVTQMQPATLGKTSLGVVPAGAWPVVLIPATSATAAYKDNGFGGRIGFAPDNGAAGTGANGASIAIGGDTYKVYGEFKLNTAEVFIYVE